MIEERTIKRMVFVWLISAGLGIATRWLPHGTTQTVLGVIASIGLIGAGLVIAYNAIRRTSGCRFPYH